MSQKLTPAEALRALADGKKIRNINWLKHQFVYLQGKRIVDDTKVIYNPGHFDDFEIYQEPKPKITLWRKPLVAVTFDQFQETNWFKSKVDFEEHYSPRMTLGEWETKEVETSR